MTTIIMIDRSVQDAIIAMTDAEFTALTSVGAMYFIKPCVLYGLLPAFIPINPPNGFFDN